MINSHTIESNRPLRMMTPDLDQPKSTFHFQTVESFVNNSGMISQQIIKTPENYSASSINTTKSKMFNRRGTVGTFKFNRMGRKRSNTPRRKQCKKRLSVPPNKAVVSHSRPSNNLGSFADNYKTNGSNCRINFNQFNLENSEESQSHMQKRKSRPRFRLDGPENGQQSSPRKQRGDLIHYVLAQNKSLQQLNQKLRSQIDQGAHSAADLNNQAEVHDSFTANLANLLERLKSDIDELESTNSQLQARLKKSKAKLKTRKQKIRELKEKTTEQPGDNSRLDKQYSTN